MVDVFSPEKRSWIMSRIRSKNTKPDLMMKKILYDLKCEFKAYPKMYGNPDFVLKGKRIAIFCDGDFWHGYNYHRKKKPSKRYWKNKIEYNMKRDEKISRNLRREGWSVLRFWEHDIIRNSEKCERRILKKLGSYGRL